MIHKLVKELGNGEIVVVKFGLADECNNGSDDFVHQIDIYSTRGRKDEGKCLHKDKLYYYVTSDNTDEFAEKHFPELTPVKKLVGCDNFGLPTYPILNGMYYFEQGDKYASEHLRLTKKETNMLKDYKVISFAKYLIHLSETRYKKEVKAALDAIKMLTGEKYVIKNKVSPHLYNDINYSLVTEKDGWNVFKGTKGILTYPKIAL